MCDISTKCLSWFKRYAPDKQNVLRGDNEKTRQNELQFLCTALTLDDLYHLMMFKVNPFIGVFELYSGQTQTDRQVANYMLSLG